MTQISPDFLTGAILPQVPKANIIHPTAMISKRAKIGRGNTFGPMCRIEDNVMIGDGNTFQGFCSIGTPAEHKTKESDGYVAIGNDNTINEFVTINRSLGNHDPTAVGANTMIGDRCYIMRGVHIGHDACIENDVTLSCNVIIGGHSRVQQHANMGLGSVMHQHRCVGPFAMVGMNSTVTKSVPPFVIAWGSPAKPYRINVIGMQRHEIDSKFIEACNYWLMNEQTGTQMSHDLIDKVNAHVNRWRAYVDAKCGGK